MKLRENRIFIQIYKARPNIIRGLGRAIISCHWYFVYKRRRVFLLHSVHAILINFGIIGRIQNENELLYILIRIVINSFSIKTWKIFCSFHYIYCTKRVVFSCRYEINERDRLVKQFVISIFGCLEELLLPF